MEKEGKKVKIELVYTKFNLSELLEEDTGNENIEDDNPVNFIKYKAYLYKDDKFIKLKSYVKDTQVKPHIYMVQKTN